MADIMGTEPVSGDTIVMPQRQGSRLWLVARTVLMVDEDDKVFYEDASGKVREVKTDFVVVF